MKGFLPSYSCLNCVSYLSSHVSDFSHLCIDFCSSYKHSSFHVRVSMFEVETDVLFFKNELTLSQWTGIYPHCILPAFLVDLFPL